MFNSIKELFFKEKKEASKNYYDTRYMCEHCGSLNGECDKDGFCAKCHCDDWLHIEVYKRGRKFFEKIVEESPNGMIYYFREDGTRTGEWDSKAYFRLESGGSIYLHEEKYGRELHDVHDELIYLYKI